MKNLHYVEVLQTGMSICLDSDTAYYYNFEIGDILGIKMKHGEPLIISINDANLEIKANFILNDRHSNINYLLLEDYLVEITNSIERNLKLKELGI
jgi:hypothetical protein